MILDDLNNLYSFGRNDEGQLGFSHDFSKYTIVNNKKTFLRPTKIDYFTEKNIIIKYLICGGNFTFVIDINNIPYSFGDNSCGQLARNTDGYANNPYPYIAQFLKDLGNIKKLCCGWSHALMINDIEEVYVWGNYFKDYKKVCNIEDIITPKKIQIEIDNSNNSEINEIEINKDISNDQKTCSTIDIASGFNHLAIIVKNHRTESKELYTWGANEFVRDNYF